MNEGRGSGAFWAFLAGIAVGTVIGILIAPDSGVNTRRRLRRKLQEYWEALRNRLIGTDKSGSSYEEVRQKAFMESGLRPDEYRKAEQLLLEIEGLLGEVRSTAQ
ncbi:MAG: YtxH domain-containing protein [Bacteroidia bacterium]|nr:YtxH domain-containing protein [Bacteroidia bacterium]MCX7764128.1 YtxH domain-containing protein [Bacteroidia bacterium]MDW8057555.1 YtxH domain-containing protein [Bacteroidia bacterium]